MEKKLVLIDGHSILNRAFYGVPDLTNSEGLHTNGIYGFLNIMFKILEEEKCDYLTVAFDVKAKTFRHEMFEAYKGTRKPMPAELHEQVEPLKELLRAMGIRVVTKEGYEADDILGTIAKKAEKEGFLVSLVSGDRDLLQLASDKIKIRIPKTKMSGTEIEDYNTEQVIEKYGVTPVQIIDLKGLMGDASDNIPGVPGIGEKRATSIIAAFGSVENAHEHIDEVTPPKARESLREHYDMAVLSKKLATIDTQAPIEYELSEGKIGNLYTEEAFSMVKRLEFKSILSRFDSDMARDNQLEESFILLEEENAAKKLLSEIKGEFGISCITAGDKLLAAGISDGERTAACVNGNGTVLGLFMERVRKAKEEKQEVGIFQLKEKLSVLPFESQDKVFDLAIAAYLLNPLKDTYNYDDIGRDYMELTMPSKGELLGKAGLEKALTEEPEKAFTLLCYEAYAAFGGRDAVRKELLDTQMLSLFETMEMPLIYTLYDMEKRGIMINKEELSAYGERLSGRIHFLETEIWRLAGEEFNINSPKQLGVILFEKLKLPFGKKTKTGYSTSAEVLEKLKCEDPIINLILEYRQLTKLKSTYADGLAGYIQEDDQRIHGKFNQTVTATGRISSTEPNLQNIPVRMELGREIRKVFIPKPGYVFLDADYSQIELRVLAHMSGDETLIEAYREAQDIHQMTASLVFHTPYDEVTPLQRRNAKAVNFGIVYGISSFGLGQDLNITRKEAEGYIKNYFDTYPGIKSFLDGLVEKGKKDGYVETIFHRRRPIPELSSNNFMQRSFGERIAMNSPIQGTAADIIKIAMIRVNEILKERELESQLILQIHDELLIETKIEEIEEVRKILEDEMHNAAKLLVPMEIDVNQGNSWYEAK
ncbi:MAG: DNA polymerase I [Acetivibrio ethanolgignens]